jgi:hypothetical protein
MVGVMDVRRLLGNAAQLRRFVPAATPKFADTVPSAQTAVDAVPDSWASRLPPPHERVRAGELPLFTADHVAWGFDRLGGIQDRTVLELGPLEGGHSYMAQMAGAKSVTAVEANPKAFLKCLVVKELFALDRCTFLCGDAMEYMSATSERFDLCIACGVLYHVTEPIRLLDLISQRSTRLILWTHFYDDAIRTNPANKRLSRRMGPAQGEEYKGFDYHAHHPRYASDVRMSGFCGGTKPTAAWLTRGDLLRALAHFGWAEPEIGFEDRLNPNGPSLALVTTRDA